MTPDSAPVHVALVTHAGLRDLDPDDRGLPAAFAAAGARAAIAIWDDPAVDWTGFDAVLLRSPWDYFRKLPAFLAWGERVAAATPLVNPWPLVRWNLDKRYLVELGERGAPVVPTVLAEAGSRLDLAALLAERGWRRAIVKPAVSADSWETHAVDAASLAAAQGHLDRLLAERAMLVQPFLEAVESAGERSLVFLDGAFSHAIRKNALTHGGRWAGLPEGVSVEASPDERVAAERILALACPDLPLYARVDLVRDERDEPRLLELELVEPTLFFTTCPGSAERFVAALLRRLGAS